MNKKNRIADSEKSLNKILTTDYETLRLNEIEKAKNSPDDNFKSWRISNAETPAIKRKHHDLKKHFSYHAGHCCECHKELTSIIYPCDYAIKHDRGAGKRDIFGRLMDRYYYEQVRQYACIEHEKKLKEKQYQLLNCVVCHTLFYSYSQSNKIAKIFKNNQYGICSSACRSYFDYHYKNLLKQQTALCKHCNAEFTPKRKDAAFCSGKCRTAHHRLVTAV